MKLTKRLVAILLLVAMIALQVVATAPNSDDTGNPWFTDKATVTDYDYTFVVSTDKYGNKVISSSAKLTVK